MTVAQIAVSRTSLGLVPLVAVDTSATSGAVVIGWNFGGVDPQNEWAESADIPGASLARTHEAVLPLALDLRLYGASQAAVRALYVTWKQALAQFSYTITETYTGGSNTYDCSPATLSPGLIGHQLGRGSMTLGASIPRQP